MDGVGISIIERPRPLPGHDTPNPTQHPYTPKCEEPYNYARFTDLSKNPELIAANRNPVENI